MNIPDNIKKVFLIGGHDLEMVTIKRILETHNFIVEDKGLTWSDAKLSAYIEELERYSSDEYRIYGVELQEDGCSIPDNYFVIDHHNQLQDMPSALEQVADIIGYELCEDELLIAANDKGYYPAMIKFLNENHPQFEKVKLFDMMNDIRLRDRNAQGVTEKEELEAKEIVDNNKYSFHRGLKIVLTSDETERFTAICDRLYPYSKLLVYRRKNPKLCYYGEDAQKVYELICKEFFADDSERYTYSGGGPNGYWGIKDGCVSFQIVERIIDAIKKIFDSPYDDVVSTHMFYFPFVWRCGYSGKDRRIKDLLYDFNAQCKWKKTWENACENVRSDDHILDEDSKSLYNELNYFFPFIHKEQYQYSDTLSDLISSSLLKSDEKALWENEPRILHFERTEKDMKYEIMVRINEYLRRKYVLDIFGINLNIYSTGVGLLSFFTRNKSNICEEYDIRDYKSKKVAIEPLDILRINQYGRRLMPPFYNDVFARSELAESIAIKGLSGYDDGLYDDFSEFEYNPQAWKYSKVIASLLNDFDPSLVYEMVIDDRMFVLSWYKDDKSIACAREEVSDCLEERTYYYNPQDLKDYWYRFLFVDGGTEPTCRDKYMKKQLLLNHTYTRWSGLNSLYGITRYSMMYLTDRRVPDYLLKYFETIYARMAELVLMQRATILKFSERVNLIANETNTKEVKSEINRLCNDYIKFKNQFYFKEVTAQDQGIEMYDMLQNSLRLGEMVKDLDEDIQELYHYHSILEEQEGNRKAQTLNFIMSFFTPASFVAAFLAVGGWRKSWGCDVWADWLGAGAMIMFSIITVALLWWNNREK